MSRHACICVYDVHQTACIRDNSRLTPLVTGEMASCKIQRKLAFPVVTSMSQRNSSCHWRRRYTLYTLISGLGNWDIRECQNTSINNCALSNVLGCFSCSHATLQHATHIPVCSIVCLSTALHIHLICLCAHLPVSLPVRLKK